MENNEQTPKQELILDLNFVPTWAREPAGANPYAHFDREERGYGGEGRRGGFRREGGGGGRPSGRGGPQNDRRPQGQGPGRRPDRRTPERRMDAPPEERRDRAPGQAPFQQRPERLPIEVSFIPERNRLALLVRDLQVSGHAYPLMDLASRFLSNPEAYLIKLEIFHQQGQSAPMKLFQCKECGMAFRERDSAVLHVQKTHLDKYFTVEQTQSEPPAGNFVCVARCKRTGVLLGPPNHHGYNEKLQELHRTRFAHLSLDEYRSGIETVREPELIEKWKQEQTTQTVYKRRDQETPEPMKKAEAESYVASHFAPALVSESTRVIVPAPVAQRLEDPALKAQIREAWQRESRHPFTLSLALRPAFRHMHLHLFKVRNGQTFVSKVRPHPVAPEQTVEPIREVLLYLQAHPGCTRQELVTGLRPALAPDSPEVAGLLTPLRWLVERGHVIEFFNGTLSVPSTGGGSRQKDKEPAPAEPSPS